MNQEKVGKLIKKIRNERGLTQSELAEKIGVTDRAISKWENGRGAPDISLLIPLSKELNVSVLELLTGDIIHDEDKTIINIIEKKDNIIKKWKYLFLLIVNIFLIILFYVLYQGYIIPLNYENHKDYGIVIIQSDSMSPLFTTGDAILYDKVNINDIKESDLILFKNETGNDLDNFKYLSIHRVIEIVNDNDDISFITRGDNNKNNDRYMVTINNYLGRYNSKLSNITRDILLCNEKLRKVILIMIVLEIIGCISFDIIYIYKK